MPAYGEALIAAAEQEPRLVALDADLRLDTGLVEFRERFPDRFFECGIAEQDMVSQAGAMALAGLLPVCHSFACFLSTRPNEQIYNNATERTKVIYVGSLAGLVPGGPGHSHQSVRDISALGAMPGMALIEPFCEHEARAAVSWAVHRAPGSVYLRLVSVPWALGFEPPAVEELSPGRGTVAAAGRRDPLRRRRAGDGRGAAGTRPRRSPPTGSRPASSRSPGCATSTAPGWPRSRTAPASSRSTTTTSPAARATRCSPRSRPRRPRTACTRSASPASRSRAATTRC